MKSLAWRKVWSCKVKTLQRTQWKEAQIYTTKFWHLARLLKHILGSSTTTLIGWWPRPQNWTCQKEGLHCSRDCCRIPKQGDCWTYAKSSFSWPPSPWLLPMRQQIHCNGNYIGNVTRLAAISTGTCNGELGFIWHRHKVLAALQRDKYVVCQESNDNECVARQLATL